MYVTSEEGQCDRNM